MCLRGSVTSIACHVGMVASGHPSLSLLGCCRPNHSSSQLECRLWMPGQGMGRGKEENLGGGRRGTEEGGEEGGAEEGGGEEEKGRRSKGRR